MLYYCVNCIVDQLLIPCFHLWLTIICIHLSFVHICFNILCCFGFKFWGTLLYCMLGLFIYCVMGYFGFFIVTRCGYKVQVRTIIITGLIAFIIYGWLIISTIRPILLNVLFILRGVVVAIMYIFNFIVIPVDKYYSNGIIVGKVTNSVK